MVLSCEWLTDTIHYATLIIFYGWLRINSYVVVFFSRTFKFPTIYRYLVDLCLYLLLHCMCVLCSLTNKHYIFNGIAIPMGYCVTGYFRPILGRKIICHYKVNCGKFGYKHILQSKTYDFKKVEMIVTTNTHLIHTNIC